MNSKLYQPQTYKEPPSYLGLKLCSMGCTNDENSFVSSIDVPRKGGNIGSAPILPRYNMAFRKDFKEYRNRVIPEEEEESLSSNIIGSCKKMKGANFLFEKSKIEQNRGDRSSDMEEDSQLNESDFIQNDNYTWQHQLKREPLTDKTMQQSNSSIINFLQKQAQDDLLLLEQIRKGQGKANKYDQLMDSIALQKAPNQQENEEEIIVMDGATYSLQNSKTSSERFSVGTTSSPHFLNQRFAFEDKYKSNVTTKSNIQSPKYTYVSPQRDFDTFGKTDRLGLSNSQKLSSLKSSTIKQLICQEGTEESIFKKESVDSQTGTCQFGSIQEDQIIVPDQNIIKIINEGYQLHLDNPKKKTIYESLGETKNISSITPREGNNHITSHSKSNELLHNPSHSFSISHPKNQQQQSKHQQSLISDKQSCGGGSMSEHMSELDEKIQYYFKNSTNKQLKKRDLVSDSQVYNSYNQTNFFNTVNQNPTSSSVSNAHRFVNLSDNSEVHEYTKSSKLGLSPTQAVTSPNRRISNVSEQQLALDGQNQESNVKSSNPIQTTPLVQLKQVIPSINLQNSKSVTELDSKNLSSYDSKSNSSTHKHSQLDLSGITKKTTQQLDKKHPSLSSLLKHNNTEVPLIPLLIPSNHAQPYLSDQLTQNSTHLTGNDTSKMKQAQFSNHNSNEQLSPSVNLNTFTSSNKVNDIPNQQQQEGQLTQRFSKPLSSSTELSLQQQMVLSIQRKIQIVDKTTIREEESSLSMEKQFSPLSSQKPFYFSKSQQERNNNSLNEESKRKGEYSQNASEALRIEQESIIEKQASHLDITLSVLEQQQHEEQQENERQKEQETKDNQWQEQGYQQDEQGYQQQEGEWQNQEGQTEPQEEQQDYQPSGGLKRFQETKQQNTYEGEFYQHFHSFQPRQAEFETNSSKEKISIFDSNSQQIDPFSQPVFCLREEAPQKLTKIEEQQNHNEMFQNPQESYTSSTERHQMQQFSVLTGENQKYHFDRSPISYNSSIPSEYRDEKQTPSQSDNLRNISNQERNFKDQLIIYGGSTLNRSNSVSNNISLNGQNKQEQSKKTNVAIPKFKNNNLFNSTFSIQNHNISNQNQDEYIRDQSYPQIGYQKQEQQIRIDRNLQQKQQSCSNLLQQPCQPVYELPKAFQNQQDQSRMNNLNRNSIPNDKMKQMTKNRSELLRGYPSENLSAIRFSNSPQFDNQQQQIIPQSQQYNQSQKSEQQFRSISPNGSNHHQSQSSMLPVKSSQPRKSVSPNSSSIIPIKPTKSSELKQKVAQEKLRGQHEEEQKKRERLELRLDQERKRQENHENQIKEQNRILRLQNQKLKEQNNLLLNQFEGKLHDSQDTSIVSKKIKDGSPKGKYQVDISSITNSQSSTQSKQISSQTSPKVKLRSHSNQQFQNNDIPKNQPQIAQEIWSPPDSSTSKPSQQLFKNNSLNSITSLLNSSTQEKQPNSSLIPNQNNMQFLSNPAEVRKQQIYQFEPQEHSLHPKGLDSLNYINSNQIPQQGIQHGNSSRTHEKMISNQLGNDISSNKYLLVNAAITKGSNSKTHEGRQGLLEVTQSISSARNDKLASQSSAPFQQQIVTSSTRQQALLARFKKPNFNESNGTLSQSKAQSNILCDISKISCASSTSSKAPIKTNLMGSSARSSKSVHSEDNKLKEFDESNESISSGNSQSKLGLKSCQIPKQGINSQSQCFQVNKNNSNYPGTGTATTTTAIQIDLKSNSSAQGRIRSQSHNQQALLNKGNMQNNNNNNIDGADANILNNAMSSIFQKIENCYNDIGSVYNLPNQEAHN